MRTVSVPINGGQDTGERLRWPQLVLVVFGLTVCFMLWSVVFPLLPLWTNVFSISPTQGGLLAALFSLPGFFVSLPAGWLLDRYPSRYILGGAWLLAALGTLLMATAPSFWALCAGRVILSIGLWVHLVGAPRLVALWFQNTRYLGLSMAFYSWGFSAGIFLGLTYLSRIAVRFGWRAPLFLLFFLSLLAFAAMVSASSGRTPSKTEAEPSTSHWKLGLPIWVAAAACLFFNAGTDAYYTYTPSYLITRGFALAKASGMVGFYAWFAFCLKPVFAIFLNRRTVSFILAAGNIVAVAALLLLIGGQVNPYVASALIGVSLALAMPALYSLPAFLLPSRLSGMGYGLLQLFLSFEFFTTFALGYSVDRTHNYQLAYLLMSAYCVVSLACAIYLHAHFRRSRIA
jgi:predicted MFS family arabinose efflux permease